MRAFVLLCLLFSLCVSLGFHPKKRSSGGSICSDRNVDPGTPLLLTPYVQQGKIAEGRAAAAASLDGVDLGFSGFFSVPSASGKNTNNLFTWFQPCTSCANVSEAPLLLWLQGGPGAPSSYGSTNEIGPYFIDGNCSLRKREYTWCDPYASCMFIDNPVQTGFSYQLNATGQYDPKNIEYTQTSKEAGAQMTQLLVQFFKLFPEVAHSDFFVTGESYAGQYVPNLALQIIESGAAINLKGVSVGDPVMNQVHQWPTYADTLYGMGLVSIAQREKIRSVLAQGVTAMVTDSCKAGFDFWNSVWNDNGEAPTPFYYKQFTGSSTTYESLLTRDPPSFAWSGDWFQSSQVARALHYGGSPADQFNEGGPIYDTMVASGDFCQNSSDLYAQLLTQYGKHVQIYSSTNDPLLGPPCSEAGVMATMETAGTTDDFLNAPRVLWGEGDNLGGYATCFTYAPKSSRFCYTIIRGAGHMSPVFQPRSNQDMTYRFIHDIPFDGPAPSNLGSGPQCSGAPPFAGTADCACNVK